MDQRDQKATAQFDDSKEEREINYVLPPSTCSEECNFFSIKHAVAIPSPTRSARAHTDLDPEILVHHGLGDFRLALEAVGALPVEAVQLDIVAEAREDLATIPR